MAVIGFLPNTTKDLNLKFTETLIDFICKKSCTALLSDEFKYLNITNAIFCDMEKLLQSSDFVIVLGGDGTILRWAEKTSIYQKKLLGINLGNLGYLTDTEKNNAMQAIENVLNNNFKTEKRMMLESNILGVNVIALNDIYISKGSISKLVRLKIYINDEYIDTYFADGIIFSTPTGSTAYNLSAGGPILKPDAEMIVITPICPHTLYARPFVISANDVIKIVVCDCQKDLIVSADGENKVIIKNGDYLYIKRSNLYTSIIKTSNLGFYDILRQKMVEIGKDT